MYKSVLIIFAISLFSFISCSNESQDANNFGTLTDRVTYLEGKIKSLETRYDILSKRIDSKKTNLSPETNKTSTPSSPKESNSPVKENISFTVDEGFSDDAYIGTAKPEILLLIYSDLSCEKCGSYLLELIPSLRSKYKNSLEVQARLRDFPLDKYPNSKHLAEATHCVGEQGNYWNFLELLLKKQNSSDDEILKLANTPAVKLKDLSALSRCLKSNKYDKEVSQDKSSGLELGVEGVPSVFIGRKISESEYKGALIRGSQDISIIHKYIDHLEANNE